MTDQDFSSMRAAMVDSQLRTSDVNDPRIIAAIMAVPREAFVPSERRAMAYIDRPVPLGAGRALNPPLATGRMLVEAGVKPGDKVLLIGAATGYAAKVLTELGAVVTAVEEDGALAETAQAAGISVKHGPLAQGAPEGAPYDVIIIDGLVEHVPQPLIDQLAEGGRLATGLLDGGVSRLCVGRKAGGAFACVRIADIEMPALPGFSLPARFTF